MASMVEGNQGMFRKPTEKVFPKGEGQGLLIKKSRTYN